MNVAAKNTEPVDVEAIVAEIRRDIRETDLLLTETEVKTIAVENDLYGNLKCANEAFGWKPCGGMKGMLQRAGRRILLFCIGDVIAFDRHVVRVLNRLVKALDGRETDAGAELLIQTRRRVNLLAMMSDRLADYDRMNVDERLRRLEQRLNCVP